MSTPTIIVIGKGKRFMPPDVSLCDVCTQANQGLSVHHNGDRCTVGAPVLPGSYGGTKVDHVVVDELLSTALDEVVAKLAPHEKKVLGVRGAAKKKVRASQKS